MSSIADFRLIETSKLNELVDKSEIKVEKKLFSKKVIDNYLDYLNSVSKELIDFQWSGYTFANLLIFLQENKGIDLVNSEFDDIANSIIERRQNSTFFLTNTHRKKYLDQLHASNFTTQELTQFNKDFSEETDPELVKAELAGIDALQKALEHLSDDSRVVLLTIG